MSVTALEPLGGGVTLVTTSTGQQLRAGAVLVATGSTYRRTGAEGEADLIGAGIHFCATCDGPFYKGATELVVLGGGNSGLEEGLFLTQFAEHVTVVERSATLRASALLQDKVAAHPKMTVLRETGLVRFNANDAGRLASVTLRAPDDAESDHAADGVFVFIGLDPNTGWMNGVVDLDAAGFVVTDRMLQTSVPGIFAAGDVRAGLDQAARCRRRGGCGRRAADPRPPGGAAVGVLTPLSADPPRAPGCGVGRRGTGCPRRPRARP